MPPSPGDDPSWSVPQWVGDAEVVPVAGVEDGVVHQRREARSVSREKLEKLLEAVKPYALGVLGGLALASVARRR